VRFTQIPFALAIEMENVRTHKKDGVNLFSVHAAGRKLPFTEGSPYTS